MKHLWLAALLLALPMAVLGQSQYSVTGNITTAGSDCTVATRCVVFNPGALTGQLGAGSITVSGTWSGTLPFEGTGDGSHWSPLSIPPLGGGSEVTSTTSNGTWRGSISALVGIRVRASALASGTAVITINTGQPSAGNGSSSGGGGPPTGAAGGDLSGTYPNPGVAQVNGAAIPTSAPLVGTNSSGQVIPATTPVAAANGGSGVASPTTHSFLLGEGASPFNLLASPATNGFYLCGFNVTGSAALDPTCSLPGVPVNTPSTPYTMLYSDRASYQRLTGGSTFGMTLPQITGNTASNFPFLFNNGNSGQLTLTPNAADKIDNGSTGAGETFLPKFAGFMYQDQSSAPGNWWSVPFPTLQAFGPTCVNGLNWSTTSGFGCAAAPPGSGLVPANVGGTVGTFWVVANNTPFSAGYATTDIDYVGMTHMIVLGGAVQASGSITACTGYSTFLGTTTISTAHLNGVKVLYGAGDCGSGYSMAAAITNNLATLVTNLSAAVTACGCDGIDIDFEIGYTQPLMASLLTALRAALPSPILITAEAAIQDNSDWNMTGMISNVDRINLLTYQMGNLGNRSFFDSGLYCFPANDWCTQKAVGQFISTVALSKVNIGIPFFGVLSTGNSVNGPRETTGSTFTNENYNTLASGFAAALAAPSGYDPQGYTLWAAAGGGWLNWPDPKYFVPDRVYYALNVNGTGVGGVFSWNLQEDFSTGQVPLHPLQNAIKESYLGYLQAPRATSPTGIQPQGAVTTSNGPGNAISLTSNFVTANNTSFQTIADAKGNGLVFYTPSFGASKFKFSCDLAYSQATANVAVAFGIQEPITNVTPSNIFATGSQQITVGPPSTYVAGTLTALSSNTATSIVSGTPGATATIYSVHLGGTAEMPAPTGTSFNSVFASSQLQLMVSTATGADAVTVYRGSQCSVLP